MVTICGWKVLVMALHCGLLCLVRLGTKPRKRDKHFVLEVLVWHSLTVCLLVNGCTVDMLVVVEICFSCQLTLAKKFESRTSSWRVWYVSYISFDCSWREFYNWGCSSVCAYCICLPGHFLTDLPSNSSFSCLSSTVLLYGYFVWYCVILNHLYVNTGWWIWQFRWISACNNGSSFSHGKTWLQLPPSLHPAVCLFCFLCLLDHHQNSIAATCSVNENVSLWMMCLVNILLSFFLLHFLRLHDLCHSFHNTHTQPFNGDWSRTTKVGRYLHKNTSQKYSRACDKKFFFLKIKSAIFKLPVFFQSYCIFFTFTTCRKECPFWLLQWEFL